MRPVWNPHPAMVLAGFAAAVPQPATALRPCEPAAAELVARLDAAVERPADEALAELDTLADLARRSDTTWLVPLTPRKPAGGVETLVPFAEAIAATRRAVWVAAASDGSRPSGELATAVADRDSARLAESLREARDPLTAAMAAAARGDLFGERGDPAAVDAWRMAAAIFASAGYPERAAKLEATAAAFTAATVREEAPLSRRLSPAWRSDFPRLAGESAGIEPVVSTGTIDGERLLIFADGHGIDVLGLESGSPPWTPPGAVSPRVRFFPPSGAAGRPAAAVPRGVAIAGGRVVAWVPATAGDRPQLVCLDLTEAAEGRLAWSAAAPRAMPLPIGSPRIVDGQVVACTAGPSAGDPVALAAFRLGDGSLAWTRPLVMAGVTAGGAASHAGVVAVAGDLTIAATAGSILWAVRTDGTLAWLTRLDDDEAGGGPLEVCQGGVHGGRLVVPRGGRLLALEARSGRLVWSEASAGQPLACVAATPSTVYLARGQSLLALAAADGRRRARIDTPAWHNHGRGVVVGSTLYRPVVPAAAGEDAITRVITADADTLTESGAPLRPFDRPGGRSWLVAADGRLVVSDTAGIAVFTDADTAGIGTPPRADGAGLP